MLNRPRAGSLFNHSTSPNITYSLDYTQYTISYRTAKPIQRGEELCIFYGHSVRFSATAGAEADAAPPPRDDILDDESQSVNDEWGGLGRVGPFETSSETSSTRGEPSSPGGIARAEKLRALKALSPEELAERDNEIIAPTDPEFRWKKVTELIDPEDADLSLCEFGAYVCPACVFACAVLTPPFFSDVLRDRRASQGFRLGIPVRPQAHRPQVQRTRAPQARPTRLPTCLELVDSRARDDRLAAAK